MEGVAFEQYFEEWVRILIGVNGEGIIKSESRNIYFYIFSLV